MAAAMAGRGGGWQFSSTWACVGRLLAATVLALVPVGAIAGIDTFLWVTGDDLAGWAFASIGPAIGLVLRWVERGLARALRLCHGAVLGVVGVALYEYTVFALYDGEGYAPEWVPLELFIAHIGDWATTDPFVVLFWLLTPVLAGSSAAFGDAEGEGEGDGLAMRSERDAELRLPMARFVRGQAQVGEPRDITMTVMFGLTDVRVVQRRLTCDIRDVEDVLPHLLDPEAGPLRLLGEPGAGPLVEDLVLPSSSSVVSDAVAGPGTDTVGWLPMTEFRAAIRSEVAEHSSAGGRHRSHPRDHRSLPRPHRTLAGHWKWS